MKKILVTGVALAMVSAVVSEASEVLQPPVVKDELVVTATRTSSTLGKVGGTSVTVITAEDIEAKQLPTVEEVLKGVPGIDIASNGGLGTLSSVFIRGADSKNTLVLVDGIIFNDVSSANRGANLGSLTTDNIERIEVVRGPMSVLYGSNATAGVINIITKKGEGDPTFYVGTEGGSYGTWKGYGGSSGAVDRFNYSFSASYITTDGYSIANEDNDRIPQDGNTSEDDGWENTTVSGKFGFDITPDFDISFVGRLLDSETDLDQVGPGYTGDRFGGWPAYPAEPDGLKEARGDSKQALGKFTVHNFFFDRFLESTLSYNFTTSEREGFNNDGNKYYDYDGDSQDITWQGQLNFNDTNLLTFGAGYFKEEIETDDITEKDADITSLWVQNQLFIGEGLDIVAGLRYDDHENFGDEVTYRIAPAYEINETGTTLKASYGTGFRAPSLFELYYPWGGNEDLEAEESEGWDVGVEQLLFDHRVKVGVTYFNMNYDNRIDWDPGLPPFGGYNQLDGDTKTSGIESFVEWAATPDLDFLFTYTYNDTEDPDGARLERRPLNKFNVNTRYRFLDRGTVNLDLFWVGERDTTSSARDKDGNNVETLDSYFLVNLACSYELTHNLQLNGRIDNVFDEDYEEAWSYATPGLSAYVGVKYTF